MSNILLYCVILLYMTYYKKRAKVLENKTFFSFSKKIKSWTEKIIYSFL